MRERLENRKSQHARWALICAAIIFLFPLSLQQLDFRNVVSGGLSISVHKSSPAFAALQDLREEYSNPLEELKSEPMNVLASGESFDPRKVRQRPALAQRVIALQGITIRAQVAFQPKPFLVAGLSTAQAPEIPPKLTDTKGDLLPLFERKRRLIETYLDEDLGVPSVTEKAKELIAEELNKANVDVVTSKVIPAASGAPIYVAATVPKQPEPKAALRVPQAILKMPPLPPKKDTSFVPDKPIAMMSVVNYDEDNLRPMWLAGRIEMKEGLAFMGDETVLTVKRVVQGQAIEAGKIHIMEGKFEIRVKEAVGRLVAELSTRNGETIGRGEVDLLTVDTMTVKGDRLEGLKIPLRPTSEGTSVQVISGYSNETQKFPVAQATVQIDAYTDPVRVDDEGKVYDRSLSHGSSFVARAESAKYQPTTVVGISGATTEAPIYTRSMVDALMNLTLDGADKNLAHRNAIVWGRILMDGKPVSGAQVELAGNYQPIYFNEIYVPDRNLTVTTKNGLYSFLMIPQGVHAVRVRYNGRSFPAQIFPTTADTVSYVEMNLKPSASTQFQIFDIFQPKVPLTAQIRVVGVDEELPVDSGGYVQYPACANPFVVEADAGAEYELSRVMVNGTPDQVEVPTVKRDWLAKLSATRGINLIPRRGVIVGMVEDQAFEVELSGYGPNEPKDIVFFDPLGNVVEGNRGVAGGGFVIYNAPMGLQTLVIHPQYSHESLTQIVVAEPAFVHMVKFNFTR